MHIEMSPKQDLFYRDKVIPSSVSNLKSPYF